MDSIVIWRGLIDWLIWLEFFCDKEFECLRIVRRGNGWIREQETFLICPLHMKEVTCPTISRVSLFGGSRDISPRGTSSKANNPGRQVFEVKNMKQQWGGFHGCGRHSDRRVACRAPTSCQKWLVSVCGPHSSHHDSENMCGECMWWLVPTGDYSVDDSQNWRLLWIESTAQASRGQWDLLVPDLQWEWRVPQLSRPDRASMICSTCGILCAFR